MERNTKGQFIKGSRLTAEERAEKARMLSISWKKRESYIGDIKDLHPKIHSSWRGIRFTEKGKQAGCVSEWESFRNFYNDVESTYKKGTVLRRKDVMLPWGPDNFMWVTPKEAGAANTKVFIEYNGLNLSIVQWAQELNIPFGVLKNRYYKHKHDYTTEEILFGKKTKRGNKIPKDINDPNCKIRAKASKMISSYRNKDIRNGVDICNITIDWMIHNILQKPCVYCGDTKRIGCDRIDNNRGHLMDNVVPCCIECNTARNNYFSFDEMKLIGKTISEIKKSRIRLLTSYEV